MQTVTGIILGLTTGVTVLIGIATGARNERDLASIMGSSIWLFAGLGLLLTVCMTVFHNAIALLMHTPVEAMRDTQHYLLICALGIPFIIGYNVVCGILRGLGDSRMPLYFVALACAINVLLDFLLVGGFHLRAMGAAIATVASQGISFATALGFLYRRGFHFPFSRRDIRLNPQHAKRILLLGAPIALQDALVNVSFLIITVIVNQMGVIASAALGVVEKIIVFAMLPPMAISSAVAAMTAQNYGAGLTERMRRCLWSGIGMALVFGVSVCLYSQFWPETLTGILRRGCHCHGCDLSTWLQHRLRHCQLCILHQFLFQRARQFLVSDDTQSHCHIPFPYTPLLGFQSYRPYFVAMDGLCAATLHDGIAPHLLLVYA